MGVQCVEQCEYEGVVRHLGSDAWIAGTASDAELVDATASWGGKAAELPRIPAAISAVALAWSVP